MSFHYIPPYQMVDYVKTVDISDFQVLSLEDKESYPEYYKFKAFLKDNHLENPKTDEEFKKYINALNRARGCEGDDELKLITDGDDYRRRYKEWLATENTENPHPITRYDRRSVKEIQGPKITDGNLILYFEDEEGIVYRVEFPHPFNCPWFMPCYDVLPLEPSNGNNYQ